MNSPSEYPVRLQIDYPETKDALRRTKNRVKTQPERGIEPDRSPHGYPPLADHAVCEIKDP